MHIRIVTWKKFKILLKILRNIPTETLENVN